MCVSAECYRSLTVSMCPDPKRSASRAPADAEEIRTPQGHLHCHSLGAAPESRGNVDNARRPLRDHPRSTISQQQQQHPQKNHRPTEASTTNRTLVSQSSPAQYRPEQSQLHLTQKMSKATHKPGFSFSGQAVLCPF